MNELAKQKFEYNGVGVSPLPTDRAAGVGIGGGPLMGTVGKHIPHDTPVPLEPWPELDMAVAKEDRKTVETVLQEAQRLVYGARQASYGHPTDDFTRTGRMWAAILNMPHISPEQVGMCMMAVKISRQCNKPSRDNMVDAAGYAATVHMVEERKRIG